MKKHNQNDYKRLIKTTGVTQDDATEISKIKHKRWEIEECFRIMKTDFTDALHDVFCFHTDYQIVSTKQMKKIFKDTKK
ncbi:hypothetical protein CG710_009635 [Lachnotalea glycerini]|uniref:Transposase IS4-like domain-containing protein n=1 Tax=Lachnotalea glycerini TaxID=1763509 RepID=A0A371JFE9_9FIRM|nr:hypothetical protein [Lachnotalea glycerini]RDY31492.1 hypothetical protein CG710_009635 [Lachnotalea glycerini]